MDRHGKGKKTSFIGNITELIKTELLARKNDKGTLVCDIASLLIAFLFARCHIAFGAYPLHIAFLSVLPSGVFLALIGAIVGSLSLGSVGVSGALAVIVVVFLRTVLSSMHANKDEPFMFREPLLLRISSSIIGAFVGGIYIIIDTGIGITSVLSLLAHILLSGALSFVFFGVFDYEKGVYESICEGKDILDKRKTDDKYALSTFAVSFLVYIFFISVALSKYDIFGISPAYVFSAAITLFFAKRFGKLFAMAIGFVCSFVISPLYAVGFALSGLLSGLFLPIGLGYGILGGGIAVILWSLYTGGAMGMVSVAPEYFAAAIIIIPVLRRVSACESEKSEKSDAGEDGSSREMVNTTVMAYISKRRDDYSKLSGVVSELAGALKRYRENILTPHAKRNEEIIETVSSFCRECPHFSECSREHPTPCMENIEKIAAKVYSCGVRSEEIKASLASYCKEKGRLAACLLPLGRGKYKSTGSPWEEYEVLSLLISEMGVESARRESIDEKKSTLLEKILLECEMYAASAVVVGESRPHLIFAGEDKDGSIITSNKLHKKIEESLGVRLGTPEYYRKGCIALCEVSAEPIYTAEYISKGERGRADVVSGDSAVYFAYDGSVYSLISDGMGSGELAVHTSQFVCDFLSAGMRLGVKKSTLLHLINKYVLGCTEECSASIDLFEFDTVRGEGCFYKCGAADSYIKRGDSIFRVRSETAPIGLMNSIDAEKIRVEIRDGDYIIMISDGVNQPPIDAAWLLEKLHSACGCSLSDYATEILRAAEKNNSTRDDMTVSVVKIGVRPS